jgi:DNA polymerase-3 subunit delta
MSVLKASAFDSFLRKPDPAIRAVLIYGEEGEAVRRLAARAVARFASGDDPFGVISLQDGELIADPGRLLDEVQALSMFGGQRAVWVKGAEQGLARAATSLLEGVVSGNMVIAEAQALARTSPLRLLFEKSAHAYVVPVYDAEPSEIAELVETHLKGLGLAIAGDALHRFIELAGRDRGLAQREAEKLALYCLGEGRAMAADVEAVCGNATGADPEELADSAFNGDVEVSDRLLRLLLAAGENSARMLALTLAHAQHLADMKLVVERGQPVDQVVRQARPPVFFKRQRKVMAQLATWPLADLAAAAQTLGAAILQTRQQAGLADAIASRVLLALARKGRALRLQRV